MNSIVSKSNTRPHAYGLYLVELIMTLAVASILMGVAVPSYSAVVHKKRVSSASSQLYMSLNTARSEALKRRSSVRVCPSANGTTCRNDGNWSEGWLIFEDINANNTPETTEIIQLVDSFDENVNIQVAAEVSDYVQFQPTGVAIGNGGNSGEFRFCHSNSGTSSRTIGVSAIGRVNSKKRTQSDCNAS